MSERSDHFSMRRWFGLSFVPNSYRLKLCTLRRDDHINLHTDSSPRYDEDDPIISFSYGSGGLFSLQRRHQAKAKKAGMEGAVYMRTGDVLIMYGTFQTYMHHGVVAFTEWTSWMSRPIDAQEKQDATGEAQRLQEVTQSEGNLEKSTRWNVTVRFIANHSEMCPMHNRLAGSEHGATINQLPSEGAKSKGQTGDPPKKRQAIPRGFVAPLFRALQKPARNIESDDDRHPKRQRTQVLAGVLDRFAFSRRRHEFEAAIAKKDAQLEEAQRSIEVCRYVVDNVVNEIRLIPVGSCKPSILKYTEIMKRLESQLPSQCGQMAQTIDSDSEHQIIEMVDSKEETQNEWLLRKITMFEAIVGFQTKLDMLPHNFFSINDVLTNKRAKAGRIHLPVWQVLLMLKELNLDSLESGYIEVDINCIKQGDGELLLPFVQEDKEFFRVRGGGKLGIQGMEASHMQSPTLM